MRQGLYKRSELTIDELKEIYELEALVNKNDNIVLKLNHDMLEDRTGDDCNDFLFYENDKLIGFLGMYGFSKRVIEVSGMVHPGYRRKKIFTKLFNAANEERMKRNINSILFIVERDAVSGKSFAVHQGGDYSFSEYKMELQNKKDYEYKHHIGLREALIEDLPEIKRQNSIYFGIPIDALDERIERNKIVYIAELGNEIIGKINIVREGNDGLICGFGVLPEYRGKGLGKEILQHCIEKAMEMNFEKIILEVSADNENALKLYKTCGFAETNIYDYYKL